MVQLLAAALVLVAASGAAAAWALWQLVSAVRVAQDRDARERSLRLMALFAPGVAAAVPVTAWRSRCGIPRFAGPT